MFLYFKDDIWPSRRNCYGKNTRSISNVMCVLKRIITEILGHHLHLNVWQPFLKSRPSLYRVLRYSLKQWRLSPLTHSLIRDFGILNILGSIIILYVNNDYKLYDQYRNKQTQPNNYENKMSSRFFSSDRELSILKCN